MATQRRTMILASVAALGGALVAAGPAQAATTTPAGPTSSVYAGYYANHATYTQVSAVWIQPAASCPSANSAAQFLVGFDGISSTTFEGIGTGVVCTNSVPAYYAWYRVSPSPQVTLSEPVSPGDEIAASVVYTATNKYTLTITDETKGWSTTVTKIVSAERSSAEIFVQGPGTGGTLADFGVIEFVDCLIDNLPLEEAEPTAVNMVSSAGILQALTSALISPTSFTVTWEHE
jgi:hypothetical protein